MMNIFKKCALCFVIATSIILCPLCLMACNNDNLTPNEKAINYGKAMSAAIAIIQQYNSDSQTSSLALEFEDVDTQNLSSHLLFVDYMNQTGISEGFDFPESAFKAILLETPETNYSIYGIHKYNVDGGNISAEMVFSYKIDGFDYGFDTADYEKIDIVYDFKNDSLISFKWASYLVEYDSFFYSVYENGTLKILKETAAEEYSTLIISTRNTAENLFATSVLSDKTYDFKSEYRELYKKYNGIYPGES